MYLIIPILAILLVIAFTFVLTRKIQGKIISDASPFSFADDMVIIDVGTIFSIQSSGIECIELQYNPNAMRNRFYEMKIHLLKTDGSGKNISYRGSRSGVQPQDIAAGLTAHRIKCVVKEQ